MNGLPGCLVCKPGLDNVSEPCCGAFEAWMYPANEGNSVHGDYHLFNVYLQYIEVKTFVSFPSSSAIIMNDLWLASKQRKLSLFFIGVCHWVALAVSLDQWLLLIDDHSWVVSLSLLVHLSFKEFPWGSLWTSLVPIFWWQIIWGENQSQSVGQSCPAY